MGRGRLGELIQLAHLCFKLQFLSSLADNSRDGQMQVFVIATCMTEVNIFTGKARA